PSPRPCASSSRASPASGGREPPDIRRRPELVRRGAAGGRMGIEGGAKVSMVSKVSPPCAPPLEGVRGARRRKETPPAQGRAARAPSPARRTHAEALPGPSHPRQGPPRLVRYLPNNAAARGDSPQKAVRRPAFLTVRQTEYNSLQPTRFADVMLLSAQ